MAREKVDQQNGVYPRSDGGTLNVNTDRVGNLILTDTTPGGWIRRDSYVVCPGQEPKIIAQEYCLQHGDSSLLIQIPMPTSGAERPDCADFNYRHDGRRGNSNVSITANATYREDGLLAKAEIQLESLEPGVLGRTDLLDTFEQLEGGDLASNLADLAMVYAFRGRTRAFGVLESMNTEVLREELDGQTNTQFAKILGGLVGQETKILDCLGDKLPNFMEDIALACIAFRDSSETPSLEDLIAETINFCLADYHASIWASGNIRMQVVNRGDYYALIYGSPVEFETEGAQLSERVLTPNQNEEIDLGECVLSVNTHGGKLHITVESKTSHLPSSVFEIPLETNLEEMLRRLESDEQGDWEQAMEHFVAGVIEP